MHCNLDYQVSETWCMILSQLTIMRYNLRSSYMSKVYQKTFLIEVWYFVGKQCRYTVMGREEDGPKAEESRGAC